jgi:hypothetical protein
MQNDHLLMFNHATKAAMAGAIITEFHSWQSLTSSLKEKITHPRPQSYTPLFAQSKMVEKM